MQGLVFGENQIRGRRQGRHNNALNRAGYKCRRQDFCDDIVAINSNRWLGILSKPTLPIPNRNSSSFELEEFSLRDENSLPFRSGQSEGYRVEKRNYGRRHPEHRYRLPNNSSPLSSNEQWDNTQGGIPLGDIIAGLFSLAGFLHTIIFNRGGNNNKKNENE